MSFMRTLSAAVSFAHHNRPAVGMYLAAAASLFLPQGAQIVDRRDGERKLANVGRLAVFLHYDRRGRIHDYVVHYLGALRQAGFEIVFVSNSPRIGEEEWAKVRPLCALMLRRRNRGHDFGAYKDALAAVGDVGGLDELILANDSVYGPLCDLTAVLGRCDHAVAAVWGMTDCWDRRYHLQSYFLLFKHEALQHPAFAEFWRGVRLVPSRNWVIRKYEIGLTQAMLKNGLRCAALYPYRQVAAALSEAVLRQGLLERKDLSDYHRNYAATLFRAVEHGTPLNPTHYFWDYLIGVAGCPFIKRDLLLRNPMLVPYVSQWETLIRQSSDYDPDLILRHLEFIARDRVV
jgi:lipopolysaccharide biosynthesis protein